MLLLTRGAMHFDTSGLFDVDLHATAYLERFWRFLIDVAVERTLRWLHWLPRSPP